MHSAFHIQQIHASGMTGLPSVPLMACNIALQLECILQDP
jgi:hypothetical protein